MLNHKTTTITTRAWCAEDIEAAQQILLQDPGLLPLELRELARDAQTESGGFPRWLVWGLAARSFRTMLEKAAAAAK